MHHPEFEASLNFYHLFLDSERVFWKSQGLKEADKCQGLIAKLLAEQQGSGKNGAGKMAFCCGDAQL